jgi:hypothetical protein
LQVATQSKSCISSESIQFSGLSHFLNCRICCLVLIVANCGFGWASTMNKIQRLSHVIRFMHCSGFAKQRWEPWHKWHTTNVDCMSANRNADCYFATFRNQLCLQPRLCQASAGSLPMHRTMCDQKTSIEIQVLLSVGTISYASNVLLWEKKTCLIVRILYVTISAGK